MKRAYVLCGRHDYNLLLSLLPNGMRRPKWLSGGSCFWFHGTIIVYLAEEILEYSAEPHEGRKSGSLDLKVRGAIGFNSERIHPFVLRPIYDYFSLVQRTYHIYPLPPQTGTMLFPDYITE